MRSLQTQYLRRLAFSSSELSTLKKIGEYKGKQELFQHQTPEILESLKKVAIIESTKCSNRIEGVTAPDERIEALVLHSTTPQNRSEREISGYRDALALIHESAPHMTLSANLILQLHSIIYRYMPDSGGHWKLADNEIVEKSADGNVHRIRFKAVSAVETPQAVEDLAQGYQAAIREHEPLVVIPLAILDLLCIHPFDDGNGRLARLLTLMLLYHFDYQVGRYISLERIFEESKETYYETLEKSSQGWHQGKHDSRPWLAYFWGVLLRAYREFEERVGTIRTSRGAKTEQVQKAVERKIGPFAISDIERDCPGVSRDMIRLVLRQMKADGVITPQGKGRGAKWIMEKR